VRRISGWRHSGFSVHSKVRAETKKEAERVGKYMTRPVLSLDKLFFSEKGGEVDYRLGEGAGHGMVRYYGLYANAHRGKALKSGGGRSMKNGTFKRQTPSVKENKERYLYAKYLEEISRNFAD